MEMELSGLSTAQIISKLLGMIVIVVVGIMKVPQIYSVLKERSAKGLDFGSLVVEIVGLTIVTVYAKLTNLPFSAYGEVYPLLIQDFILVWAICYFNRGLGLDVVLGHLLYLVFAALAGLGYITMQICQYLVLLTLPTPYVAMTLQIMTIRADKSSGTLALLSFFFGLFSIVARVYTTAVETDDKILLYNSMCLTVMNVVLTYYVLKYRDQEESKKDH